MKKTIVMLSVLILAFTLTACETVKTPEVAPVVMTKNVYLIPKIEDDIISVPSNVKGIDLEKATQLDVAKWMVENEKRTAILENKLLATKNITAALIKKENLKDGDYKVIELKKEELLPDK